MSLILYCYCCCKDCIEVIIKRHSMFGCFKCLPSLQSLLNDIPSVQSLLNDISCHSHFQWAVLTCGHCYCKDCIEVMIKRQSMFGRFKCPVCRTPTSGKEISYVSTVETQQEETQDNEIKIKVRTNLECHT